MYDVFYNMRVCQCSLILSKYCTSTEEARLLAVVVDNLTDTVVL